MTLLFSASKPPIMLMMIWSVLIIMIHTAEAFQMNQHYDPASSLLRQFSYCQTMTSRLFSTMPPSRRRDGEMDFFFPIPSDDDKYAMEEPSLLEFLRHHDNKEQKKQPKSLFSKFRSFSKGQTRRQESQKNQQQEQKQEQRRRRLQQVEKQEENSNIQCYLVNYDAVQQEGATPEVYCTSNKEEFAWFHGLDVNDLVPTEILPSLALDFFECAEGASHRGNPEWECKMKEPKQPNKEDQDEETDWKNFGI